MELRSALLSNQLMNKNKIKNPDILSVIYNKQIKHTKVTYKIK